MESARPTQMQNWCKREGRLPETRTAGMANENLVGHPQPVTHRHLQENQCCAQGIALPRADHGGQHLSAQPPVRNGLS